MECPIKGIPAGGVGYYIAECAVTFVAVQGIRRRVTHIYRCSTQGAGHTAQGKPLLVSC